MPGTPWGQGRHDDSRNHNGPGGKGDKHAGKKRKHRERPCPNPPAAPANVICAVHLREEKTDLEFSGKIKWDGVFADEQGHKIPGGSIEIDHYEGEYGFTLSTTPGDWAETADGDPRIRRFHKKAVKGIRVTNATITSGTTAEFTTVKAHGFVVDEQVRVQDCKPAAYNGKWTVTSVPTTTTFRADISASPTNNKLENTGTATGEPDPNYDWIVNHLPNPRKYYFTARVRAWDNKNCPSDWSDWTTPISIFSGARPKPPVVTGIDINWEKADKHRHNRWVGVVVWNEVTDFDYPGTYADDQDDVARYVIQVQASADGSTPIGTTRRYSVEAKDADADSTAHVRFHRINKRYYYRARVRCVDRFNRRGDWPAAWTSWERPGASVPPSPTNVTILESMKDSIAIKLTSPIETGETDVVDEEIEHYAFQISTSSTFTSIYDRATTPARELREKKTFHIPPADRDLTFYGRARSVSQDNERSDWIPATTGGNSSSGATPSGVTIVRDRVIATFTKNGTVEAKHYPQLWMADRRYKFKKVRVRFGKHDANTHPNDGCPTGSSAIVQVKWHNADESMMANLFASDSRLTVSASSHKDTNWADDMTRLYMEEDESLSVKVTQVGSTNPGEDMVVQVVMVPDEGTQGVAPTVIGTAVIPTPSVTAT